MKKHLIIILCLIMVLSSVVIISANAKTNCKHDKGWSKLLDSDPGDCNHYGWEKGICKICKETHTKYTGKYGSHVWVYNGCENPQKCKYTNHRDAKGPVVHHSWSTATCAAPAYCPKCDTTKGTKDPNNHLWVGGNCTTEAHCARCPKTGSKNPNNHLINPLTGKCYRCGK